MRNVLTVVGVGVGGLGVVCGWAFPTVDVAVEGALNAVRSPPSVSVYGGSINGGIPRLQFFHNGFKEKSWLGTDSVAEHGL